MSLAERLARASGSENKLGDVRERVQARLIDALGPKLYDPNVSDEDVEYLVNQRLRELLADETSLSGPERAEVSRTIADMVLGLGPIEEFLKAQQGSAITERLNAVYSRMPAKVEPALGAIT